MSAPQTTILYGDAWELAETLDPQSIDCIVTSPPYWGLRDYGHPGQFGLERTPHEYVTKLVDLFARLRPALKDDGTLWLNLGDSYNAYNGGAGPSSSLSQTQSRERPQLSTGYGLQCRTLKPKDLVGIPWRVAFALQEDGWYLRSDIIWAKPMPESVTDRPTKSHEYLFLLAKSERYYFDQEAVRETAVEGEYFHGGYDKPGIINQTAARNGRETRPSVARGGFAGKTEDLPGRNAFRAVVNFRNIRTVWNIATHPYPEAHFATFPPKLIEPCIKAGCPEGGTVLDPFLGSGTTAEVARKLGRNCVGFELNEAYRPLIEKRLAQGVLV